MSDVSQANTWPVAAPGEQGVDPLLLASAYDRAAGLQPLHSLLVARHGYLVGEQYFGRDDPYSSLNIKSASKSIVSALVGIALREGLLKHLDQPIVEWLAEYIEPQADPRKRAITLRHLLTMSAGLGWVENAGSARRWRHSGDWVKFALDLPMVSEPGRQFNYNTTLTHLLSVILARASGASTLAFAQRYLFDPLGVAAVKWKTDPQGYHVGGADISMTARDMAAFGQLCLRHGMWGGRSIVPAGWVAESTRPQIALEQPGFWHPAYTHYGYLWWLRKLGGHDAAVASGYAGQIIFVAPDLDLVVVTTADADVPFSSVMQQANRIEDLVETFVIPSIQEEN